MDDIKIKGLEKQLIGPQDAELVEEYTIKIPLEKTQIKRKLILQFMYSLDLSEDIKNVSTSALSLDTSDEFKDLASNEIKKCRKTSNDTYKKKELLDDKIQSFAKEYPISQLSVIDKCILRLAFWEVENDALECNNQKLVEDFEKLGYLFGSDNSHKFIRGVLRSLTKRKKGNYGNN